MRLVRWALVAVGIAVVIGAPLVLDVNFTIKASAIFAFAIIGLSLVVLTGWAGQISLGQMAHRRHRRSGQCHVHIEVARRPDAGLC